MIQNLKKLKLVVLFAFISIAVLLSSGCGFLLSKLVQGSGSREYVLRIYVQGLPKTLVDQIRNEEGRLELSKVSISQLNATIRVSAPDVSEQLSIVGKENIFNEDTTREIRIISKSDTLNLTLNVSLETKFATDTIIGEKEFRKEFTGILNNVRPEINFILINFYENTEQPSFILLPESSAFKFIVQSSVEEFVFVKSDFEQILFTSATGTVKQFVYFTERNKSINFVNERGTQIVKISPSDSNVKEDKVKFD